MNIPHDQSESAVRLQKGSDLGRGISEIRAVTISEEVVRFDPLLVEIFTDPEQDVATCDRAAGGEPAGYTRSFGRYRSDFFNASVSPPCCATSN